MQSVAQVVLDGVALDDGFGGEFQIDAVAVVADLVARDGDAFAGPEMDAVAGFLLAAGRAADIVVNDPAVVGFGKIDAEIAIAQNIVGKRSSVRFRNSDPREILKAAHPAVADFETTDLHIRRGDGDDFAVSTAINHGPVLAGELEATCPP